MGYARGGSSTPPPRTSYNLRSRRGAGALEQDNVTEVSLNWLGSRSEDAPEEAN